MRKYVIMMLFAIVVAESVFLFRQHSGVQKASFTDPEDAVTAIAPQPAPPSSGPQRLLPENAPGRLEVLPHGKYVVDVVLHSYEEIDQLLNKAEEHALRPRPADQHAAIAIVLHGPEIDLFSIRNYQKYQSLVDKAARLDAYNIIDVKMCQTTMRKRGLRNQDVPGFIELVPYAPEEIEQLQQQGFVKI
jgi:intracellular sulfur oxidation DsrE/DsrF family protein